MQSYAAKQFFCILLLACMWGPSFMFIKIALTDIPPISVAALRVALAALILGAVVWWQRAAYPRGAKLWAHIAVIAIFSAALPFALISVAEQHIESALAGIVNGMTPVLTALLAHWLIHDERMSVSRIMGMLLGFIGFLLLLLPTVVDQQVGADTWSILAVAGAAACYAIGVIYGRLFVASHKTLALPLLQMIFSSLYLVPVALWFEGIEYIPHVSLGAWSSLFILGFWGTACAFILYFHIIRNYGAVALSTVTFLFPVFSIFLGVVFLHEQLTWLVYAGTLFILAGMQLINKR